MSTQYIQVPKEEYESLRRLLSTAQETFQSLRVREQEAPKLSKHEQRKKKYNDLIEGKLKVRKPKHLRKS